MSAIGAIFNFNNRPFDEDDLHDLAAPWQSLSKWGPDGGRIVTSDSCGVCYQAFHTNREPERHRLPVVSVAGDVFAAYIRIDNSVALLAAPPHPVNTSTV